jgi:hypothetical protein
MNVVTTCGLAKVFPQSVDLSISTLSEAFALAPAICRNVT